MTPLAHGIGGVRDLPVPETFFFTTAAVVLVVSFLLLGVLWKRPLLERAAEGRLLPEPVSRAVLSTVVRVILGAISVGLLFLTIATGLFGTSLALLNFAPTFVYVPFWLGIPLLSVLLGNVWSVLSPWRALADATVWVLERGGREARPVLEPTERFGRYPAAVALSSFVALELAHPNPDLPRNVGVAAAIYSYWALAGMAIYGRDTWTRSGEAFAVAFGLFARIAPFAARDGRVVVRWPFSGLAGADRTRGALLFVAVMLGSTSFDGFSRTTLWTDSLGDVRADLQGRSGWVIDLAETFVNLLGLCAVIAAVALTYLAATWAARRLVNAPRSLVPDFVLSLVPIAFAYLVAHYFSFFVIYMQFLYPLASDPFGRGWDLFGTVDAAPNLALLSPETVWYVQVISLTVGHVAGLAVAHDRAVALFENRADALRSQYPMLALMVLYTVGGLWLLSQS